MYSIVIPARNEEQTIGEVLRGVRDMTDDLIVLDGHSTDRTIAIAREYGATVVQDTGRGKGDAVRVALELAVGKNCSGISLKSFVFWAAS
jgi:dolichol-phosphate hexosyltransferase